MKWEEFIEKIRDIGITLPKIESWNYLPIEEGYKVYRDILCNLLEDIPTIKNDTFLSIYICDFKIKKVTKITDYFTYLIFVLLIIKLLINTYYFSFLL